MKKLHPLINENSSHYEDDGKVAIQELEKKLTVIEMLGWCKGNIFKYEFRKELKGALEADEVKIGTYKAYLEVLKVLCKNGIDNMTVAESLDLALIRFRYK